MLKILPIFIFAVLYFAATPILAHNPPVPADGICPAGHSNMGTICQHDEPVGPGPDTGGIGTIEPPDTIPTVTGDPSTFVSKLIKNGISLLLIVSFIIFFIWTILAGLQFIFASGDEKAIGSAWSRIYWGLIGIAVVLSSYAIVKLVEIFFEVDIFTNFRLPGS